MQSFIAFSSVVLKLLKVENSIARSAPYGQASTDLTWPGPPNVELIYNFYFMTLCPRTHRFRDINDFKVQTPSSGAPVH